MKRNDSSRIALALLLSASGCFLIGAGVTVCDVALRATVGRNVPAAIELTSFWIGLGALLSMPACYATRTHVTARLLSELNPRLFGRPLGLLGAVASVLFAAVMFWMVAANAWSKLGSPETSRDLNLSMPVLLSIVTATLAVALVAAVAGLWSELRKARA
jgi:TRAP-type C4-dicarboxylate transport system permease small subunit